MSAGAQIINVITETIHRIIFILRPTSILVNKQGIPKIKSVLVIKQTIDLLAWKPKPGNLIILKSINVIINSLKNPRRKEHLER